MIIALNLVLCLLNVDLFSSVVDNSNFEICGVLTL